MGCPIFVSMESAGLFMSDTQQLRPDYLVLGHITKDLIDRPPGYAPGGTALYSALTARRLGLQAALVTACAPDDRGLLNTALEAGIWVHSLPSEGTTTFRNLYDSEGRRTQVISGWGRPIEVGDVPPVWRDTPIVHLGPVAQELSPELTRAFPLALLGVTPQGWMRAWDDEGHIEHSAWPLPAPLEGLPANAFLVVSTEDLGNDDALIERYADLAPLVAVTRGPLDAYLFANGVSTQVPAFPASPVDPTGAGDVFAAALFVRYRETGDLRVSARFAHAAAACNIEGPATSAIPDRATVQRRVAQG
jgi:sugar/nucleoside kinase (ribokinase family)